MACRSFAIIDETSNGIGAISDMTLEQLRSYDFGSYFHDEFRGTKLPTLDEFLTLCATADIEIMNIELKTPLSGEKGIVKETLAAVKEHGLFDKLLVSSFSPELLVECKRLDPACKTGFLYSPNGIGINVWTVDGDGIAKRMLDCGVDGIITNVPDMINALVERY